MSSENIREIVKEKYGDAAKTGGLGTGVRPVAVLAPLLHDEGCDPITSNIYGTNRRELRVAGERAASLTRLWQSDSTRKAASG